VRAHSPARHPAGRRALGTGLVDLPEGSRAGGGGRRRRAVGRRRERAGVGAAGDRAVLRGAGDQAVGASPDRASRAAAVRRHALEGDVMRPLAVLLLSSIAHAAPDYAPGSTEWNGLSKLWEEAQKA